MLERWRAGDTDAGKTLFERYYPLVERFFATKVGAAAEDLIQSTFMACLKSRDRISDGAQFRPYLLGIARHTLIDHFHRQRKRRGHLDVDEELSSLRDGAPSPSAFAAEEEERRTLVQALQALPIDHQIVLELHYWEELQTDEIAHVLGIPRGTVKSRLRLARDGLRKRLHELTADPNVAERTITNLEAMRS